MGTTKKINFLARAAAPLAALLVIAGRAPAQQLGYIPTPASEAAKSAILRVNLRGAESRPSSLLLVDHLPPIGNQHAQGSCVGWAIAYACFSSGVNINRKLDPSLMQKDDWEFSPAFVYHLRRNPGDGMTISNAVEILKQYGCASLHDMPYDDHDDRSQPSAAAFKNALTFKLRPEQQPAMLAELGQKTPDAEEMKEYLARTGRPFVIGITLFDDFPRKAVDPDFVYTKGSDKVWGGHAMAVVGYDDSKHAFRFLNSWGPSWGDHGFLWISEDYVVAQTHEAWGFAPGGLVGRRPNVISFPGFGIDLIPPSH